MSEEEMYESDLHTIYRLIDIHASFNNPKKTKNDKSNYTNKTKNPSSISSNYSSQSYIREKPISIQNSQKRIISLKKKTSSIANIAYYKKNEN